MPPGAIPVTTPEVEFTVAAAVLLLLHVPPDVASVKVVVRVAQRVLAPVTAAGVGLTVNGVDTAQPVGNVNVIVNVPADAPETIPVLAPTDAKVGLLLVHVEVPETSVSVVVEPTQTFVIPPIAAGNGFTVMG